MPATVHHLHPAIARKLEGGPYNPLRILVAGAGGNGSKVAIGLRHLHTTLQALYGTHLHVTLADGDTLEDHNLVRQAFYPPDVGQNKATVLAHRLNLSTGTRWDAHPENLTRDTVTRTRADILIACVDSRAARHELHEGANDARSGIAYTIDLGNDAKTGQVILGMPKHRHDRSLGPRLPTAPELFPELVDTTLPEDDAPSCSTAESLERQDLFVNDTLATNALNLLWQLLRNGRLAHHGVFLDTSASLATPLPVDPAQWARMRRRARRRAAA